MSVLTYQAFDQQGREVAGTIEAESHEMASEALRRQGIVRRRLGRRAK